MANSSLGEDTHLKELLFKEKKRIGVGWGGGEGAGRETEEGGGETQNEPGTAAQKSFHTQKNGNFYHPTHTWKL